MLLLPLLLLLLLLLSPPAAASAAAVVVFLANMLKEIPSLFFSQCRHQVRRWPGQLDARFGPLINCILLRSAAPVCEDSGSGRGTTTTTGH
uniref:HDC08319 n=1 Tax=Drosophila melanogaster TaxID=7227 RepID=Q6ILU3_DROME|nr:TPA_inf: HDC08319 [Drosophila melanogaster]